MISAHPEFSYSSPFAALCEKIESYCDYVLGLTRNCIIIAVAIEAATVALDAPSLHDFLQS